MISPLKKVIYTLKNEITSNLKMSLEIQKKFHVLNNWLKHIFPPLDTRRKTMTTDRLHAWLVVCGLFCIYFRGRTLVFRLSSADRSVGQLLQPICPGLLSSFLSNDLSFPKALSCSASTLVYSGSSFPGLPLQHPGWHTRRCMWHTQEVTVLHCLTVSWPALAGAF